MTSLYYALVRILVFFVLVLGIVSIARADIPYNDADFGCSIATDADRYIRDFNVDVESFGGRELCNFSVDTKKLLNDFTLIEKSSFVPHGKSHDFLRGFVDPQNYYTWMKSNTYGVRRGHDIPYATAYNSGGYFTMQDGWAALSTLGRVGTIIHEARHTEGYSHTRCNQGPYRDTFVSGCDTTFASGGSHGVEMEYYARVVLEGENLHPVYKRMARLMALGRSNWVFNRGGITPKYAVVVSGEAGVAFLDERGAVLRDKPAVDQSYALKSTSFGASFWKNREVFALDLYSAFNAGVNTKDDYSYFKLLFTPGRAFPQNVSDLEEIDLAGKRYFLAMNPRGDLSKYEYANGEWGSARATRVDTNHFSAFNPKGERGVFVVARSGTVYSLNPETMNLSESSERWDSELVAVATGSNLPKLRLNRDGKVRDLARGDLYAPLKDFSANQMIAVPVYDTFQVER